jgi:Zinc-binding dehydrogenase
MGALTAGASRLLEEVLAGTAAGRPAPVIDRTYPLQDAAQAPARIGACEVIGKSLLIIDGRRDDRRHRPPPRSAATSSA